MDFKTKDLLVKVLPRDEAANPDVAKVCLLHTVFCLHPTYCAGGSCFPATACRCTLIGTFCNGCSRFLSCIACSGHLTGGCQIFNSCGPGGSPCDPTIFCAGSFDPFVIEHQEDLVSLRADLKATLGRLDEIEKAGLPSSIGTKAEAQVLEDGLQAALEQVRAAKKGLK